MYFCVISVALVRLALEVFSWTVITAFIYVFFLISFWWSVFFPHRSSCEVKYGERLADTVFFFFPSQTSAVRMKQAGANRPLHELHHQHPLRGHRALGRLLIGSR